jgi:exopolysaccharide biosynthesis protein
LQVVITRRVDSSIPLEWFETEIWARNGEAFRTVVTDPVHPGRKFQYPFVIAREAKAVLAFSDDFYANRIQAKETVGIIIREGQLISSKTNKKTGHHLPNLDMMAQYPDGTLQVYQCNEITAEELLARGARNVFSFGPILIRDGEINDLVYTYYKSIEPRHALGIIEPNHYFLLSAQGRNSDSKGTTLQRMAEIMKEHGVQQALNLDGGNTMALVFRGRMLNKLAVYKKREFVRTVTSLIGIGMTEHQSEE